MIPLGQRLVGTIGAVTCVDRRARRMNYSIIGGVDTPGGPLNRDPTSWHRNCTTRSEVPWFFKGIRRMHVAEMLRSHRRSLGLTPREREVACLVARGMSNKQVARELGLGSGTVKLHLHRAFQKLGVKRRSSLRGHERWLAAAE